MNTSPDPTHASAQKVSFGDVDEDISVEGLLLGMSSIEARRKAEAG